jgi:hypothetical protein
MDASSLDEWLKKLDSFYEVYQFIDQEKVTFAKLCVCGEALLWWGEFL